MLYKRATSRGFLFIDDTPKATCKPNIFSFQSATEIILRSHLYLCNFHTKFAKKVVFYKIFSM